MRLATSLTRVSIVFSFVGDRSVRSEWDDGGEQAGSGYAASECAAEFDGVDRYVFSAGEVGLVGVDPTGGTSQLEHEALGMTARPFSDNVGNDATIVVGAKNEWLVEGVGQVDTVHPLVAYVYAVDEVA